MTDTNKTEAPERVFLRVVDGLVPGALLPGQTYPADEIREEYVRADLSRPAPVTVRPFQERVQPWMMACFGAEISADVTERNHRFLEEALELVQSKGCTADEAHQLVDYVYGRDIGEPHQEVGGVMVTLAALCVAADLDMDKAAEDELARIWTKVEKIRAKQAAKPKHSPLPQHVTAAPQPTTAQAARVLLAAIPNPIFDDLKGPMMGEHSVSVTEYDEHDEEYTRQVTIPWDVCKDILSFAIGKIAEQEQTDDRR